MEEIIRPFRQSGHYFDRMMLSLDLSAIGKKREYGRVAHIFLFVDEIPEDGKRSSWLYPAMHEG